MTSPIRPTDDEARTLARDLLRQARFAALAVLDETGRPVLSRVAFGLDHAGAPISLVSTLAAHTQAVQQNAQVSLLIGEPKAKGDPLTHPRLTLNGRAELLPNSGDAHDEMAAHYLRSHPKSKLYIGFKDFHFMRVEVQDGFLNGGFGKAFLLRASDVRPTPEP